MLELIFHNAPPDGLVSVGPVGTGRQWLAPAAVIGQRDWPQDVDVYYSPALRSTASDTKEAVKCTRVLWADVDLPDKTKASAWSGKKIENGVPVPTLPPSLVVWSGWGYHLYWMLEDWCYDREDIERANSILASEIGGDPVQNCNRLLRLPGTTNHKHGQPLECRVIAAYPYTYPLKDVLVSEQITKPIRHKIRTGDRRGYTSRSERDFAVLRGLLSLSDATIQNIFDYHKIGDKYQDAETGGEKYLSHSLAKARSVGDSGMGGAALEFEARDDGYYVSRGKSVKRVSTFTLEPTLLLEGDEGDALVCDVTALGYTWRGVTFTRKAFQNRQNLDKECPLASWQWLGNDDSVRLLLPYLIERLESKGLPRVKATSILGVHHLPSAGWWGVGNSASVSEGGVFDRLSAPLVYLKTGREGPVLSYTETAEQEAIQRIGALLPLINTPETSWPTIGWYFAAPFKPALESLTPSIRFPILNLYGTRGSGKTTTIQRVFLPLLGHADAKGYDANTTRFVVLSIMESTNCIPVSFNEFRAASVGGFIRYILLSYDTGHDPRGRADQTTRDYVLRAPFSVDGEDQIADAACKERMIAVNYRPDNIREGTPAWEAHNSLQVLRPSFNSFATSYLQHVLSTLNSKQWLTTLSESQQAVHQCFTSNLPDRIRSNLSVCFFGMAMFCSFTQSPLPSPTVLSQSLDNVFSQKMGRTATLADEFVQDLILHLNTHRSNLQWEVDGYNVYFILRQAWSWWAALRNRTNTSQLAMDAIRTQLAEADYSVKPEARGPQKVWMHGVDLQKAYALGLEVPEYLTKKILQLEV